MKKYDEISKIPHSRYVTIAEENEVVTITINQPTRNMQTDMANFESLALIYKCIRPNIKVKVQFQEYKEWKGTLENLTKEDQAYLRFLYRMIMFEKAFDWVQNAEENKKEISRFEKVFNEALKEGKVTNNFPTSDATYNPDKGEEHRIENKLGRTKQGQKYLQELYQEHYPDSELTCIYTQLPNGLYHNSSNEKLNGNKLFITKGDYDIWGMDKKGNLCIFELKKNKKNEKLGVISELFFYSIFAQKIHGNKQIIHEKKKMKNFRGYDKLYDAVQADEIKNINAIFLLGEGVHAVIKEWDEELKKLLNTNKFGIHYDFLYYDMNKVAKIPEDKLMQYRKTYNA